MLLLGWIYIARGPWHFGDFCNIFVPNRSEDQKKSDHLSAGPGTVPYAKLALIIELSSYCRHRGYLTRVQPLISRIV